jgi:hypothetical protein
LLSSSWTLLIAEAIFMGITAWLGQEESADG